MTPEKRIECRVRLTADAVAITSPRTGKTLTVPHSAAPARLRGRIAQARGTGKASATFTADELRAFAAAALASPVETAPLAPTPLWGGWRRPRGRKSRRLA